MAFLIFEHRSKLNWLRLGRVLYRGLIDNPFFSLLAIVCPLGGSVEIFLTDWNAAHETTST